jgi:hypothetical protein
VVDDESVDATLTEDSAEDTGSVDWQKRYTDTQAEYTRNQQALADERKVWEDEQALLARVQEKFPHLLEEGEEETEDETDFEDTSALEVPPAVQKELDNLRQWRQSIDGERSQQQFERDLKANIDLDTEVEDEDARGKVHDLILARTLDLQRQVGDGPKALKQAVEEFRAITAAAPKKSRPKAPHVPAGGQPGTGVKDWSQMSRDEQTEYMVERARALEAQ